MKITAEVTRRKILNINMMDDEEILMLSIPMENNVIDMSNEVLFTRYDNNNKPLDSGTKNLVEIFNIFRHECIQKSVTESEIRKPFIVANVRDLLNQFNREEISFSFMVEKLNEMAFEYSDKKNQKLKDDFEDIRVLNVDLNEDLKQLENELADSKNIIENLRNNNLVISRDRDEMEASYEKSNRNFDTLFAIADEMTKDLIEQSEFFDGGFESVARFYNFKHDETTKK